MSKYSVKFEDKDVFESNRIQFEGKSWLSRILLSHSGGLIKTEQQVNTLLIIVTAVFFLASIIIFFGFQPMYGRIEHDASPMHYYGPDGEPT